MRVRWPKAPRVVVFDRREGMQRAVDELLVKQYQEGFADGCCITLDLAIGLNRDGIDGYSGPPPPPEFFQWARQARAKAAALR